MKHPISTADLRRLADIVREVTGNQVQEKNLGMIETRFRTYMIQAGIDSMEDYWSYYASNETTERSTLQSLMTTHHTFFFREYTHFEQLAVWIESEVPRLKQIFKEQKTPVKIWSAAASRGQEAYSLAMFLDSELLAKHGIPYQVLGTDIDAQCISYAQNGVYPISEVNSIPRAYLSKNWKKGTGKVEGFAALKPEIRDRVRFDTCNLVELDKYSAAKDFDVIFCRNVLIYFSESDVRKIVTGLASRLNPNGLFVTGVSEPIRFPGWNLANVGPSTYKKIKASNSEAKKSTAAPIAARSPVLQQRAAPTREPRVLATASVTTKYRVLCVDDSPTIQALIKKIFSQDADCAYVDSAANGLEAREKLDRGKFDLITLDIHMPIVNGIEFLEKHYKRNDDPPVVMISSVNRSDLDLAAKAMKLGAFDYVEKPAMNNIAKSAAEILTKTRMALRQRDNQTEVAGADFQDSISKQIVIPDASSCVRIVMANSNVVSDVGYILQGQKDEYRSPSILIVVPAAQITNELEAQLITMTQRTVKTIRSAGQPLRPNTVYLIEDSILSAVLDFQRTPKASIQLLVAPTSDQLKLFARFSETQILVREGLSGVHLHPLKMSDLAPATSFASLSAEYFASVRKAAA